MQSIAMHFLGIRGGVTQTCHTGAADGANLGLHSNWCSGGNSVLFRSIETPQKRAFGGFLSLVCCASSPKRYTTYTTYTKAQQARLICCAGGRAAQQISRQGPAPITLKMVPLIPLVPLVSKKDPRRTMPRIPSPVFRFRQLLLTPVTVLSYNQSCGGNFSQVTSPCSKQ